MPRIKLPEHNFLPPVQTFKKFINLSFVTIFNSNFNPLVIRGKQFFPKTNSIPLNHIPNQLKVKLSVSDLFHNLERRVPPVPHIELPAIILVDVLLGVKDVPISIIIVKSPRISISDNTP